MRRQPRRGRHPGPHGAAAPRGMGCRRAPAEPSSGSASSAPPCSTGRADHACDLGAQRRRGFEVATKAFESWVVPVSVTILIILFLVQRRGTERISRVFGPVMIVWFLVIGVLGLAQIVDHPGRVLRAVWPGYGVELFVQEPAKAFLALGSIFLVVTGGEALYADMGHFGRRPIQVSWYMLVMPALLNYFGQAALLASNPTKPSDSRSSASPRSGRSLWRCWRRWRPSSSPGPHLGRLLADGPGRAARLSPSARHPPHVAYTTSARSTCRSSTGCHDRLRRPGDRLPVVQQPRRPYGIAVTTTMTITTLLFYRVTVDRWGWSRPKALAVTVPLLVVDMAFLTANIPKIPTAAGCRCWSASHSSPR